MFNNINYSWLWFTKCMTQDGKFFLISSHTTYARVLARLIPVKNK